MTGRWLTLNAAATRIHEETGKHTSIEDVLLLGERKPGVTVRFEHQHYSVLEESVTTYLAGLAGPTVRGGDVLPAEIEADYERRKDHDDTPNDEGDDQR